MESLRGRLLLSRKDLSWNPDFERSIEINFELSLSNRWSSPYKKEVDNLFFPLIEKLNRLFLSISVS